MGAIGVGYDGSEESREALAHAEELAEAFGATLKVITIAPYIGIDAGLKAAPLRNGLWAERLAEGADLISSDVRTEHILREGKVASRARASGGRG